MNANDLDRLELLSRRPAAASRAAGLLFVHGAYTGAWCWDEHFLPYFAGLGYEAHALSLSGHGGSPDRRLLDSYSIDNYVADVMQVMDSLRGPLVLIGHSMGGLVVQKALEKVKPAAVALLASVPPQGLLVSAMGLAMRRPTLMSDLNRLLGGGRVGVDNMRSALFHQPLAEHDLRRYLRASQPESHRAIWDMTLFNLPRVAHARGLPMLVLGAEHDELIPVSQVDLTARSYGIVAEIVPGFGHAMMLERDWQEVAGRIAAWLDCNNL